MKQVSFYGRPAPNGADNDVEWVRKVSRASGDLVNVLAKERKRPDGRPEERERKNHPETEALGGV